MVDKILKNSSWIFFISIVVNIVLYILFMIDSDESVRVMVLIFYLIPLFVLQLILSYVDYKVGNRYVTMLCLIFNVIIVFFFGSFIW